MVDGKPAVIEIVLGNKRLGDRCFCRVNQNAEQWFNPHSDLRNQILEHGKNLLKQALTEKTLTFPDGTPYTWE